MIKALVHELSVEQAEGLATFRRRLASQANSTVPCNRELVKGALETLYMAAELTPPGVVWCENPAELAMMPMAVEAFLRPERKPIVERLIGAERLDMLMIKLSAQYDSVAFEGYGTLLGQSDPRRNRAARQLGLMRRLNRVFRKNSMEEIRRTYRQKIVADASFQIAEDLQGLLLRDFLPRMAAMRAAVAEQLNRALKQTLTFRDWFSNLTLRPRPESEDSRSHPTVLETDRNPYGRVYAPFPARVLTDVLLSTVEDACCTDIRSALTALWVFQQSTNYGWSSIPWLAQYDYCRRYVDMSIFEGYNTAVLDAWWHIALEAWAYTCQEFLCFVSDRPVSLSFDEGNRLHHASEPSLIFADGTKIFVWHGTTVSADIVERPETIKVRSIDEEQNSEVRRVMVERYGLDRYLEKSGYNKIHEDDFGVLYRKNNTVSGQGRRLREPLQVVKVVNSTPEADGSYKGYILRVPPPIRTARAAVAWTFGLKEADYSPTVET